MSCSEIELNPDIIRKLPSVIYQDLEYRINLRVKNKVSLYPWNEMIVDSQVTINHEINHYNYHIEPSKFHPHLKLNSRDNVYGIRFLYHKHKGKIRLHIRNESDQMVQLSEGTIVGVLFITPFAINV